MPVIDIVRANFNARRDIQAELRSIDEACTTDNRDYTDEERQTITDKRSQLEAIDDRIKANLEMESRSQEIDSGLDKFLGVLAARESGEIDDYRSVGQRFVAAEGYEQYAKSPRGDFGVEMDGLDLRAVTDTTTSSTSGGALTRPERLTRIGQDFLDRRVYLLDLLPHIQTNQGAVEYVQDKTPLADLPNKPVEVTEGGAKAQAGLTTAVVTEPMSTVAAWVNITRQVAADVPQIQSYLDGRLRYALKRRADSQVINGDGISPNIKGLKNRSGILTNAPGGAEARFITIRHSITLMEQNEAVPEIIVLNPADAELFDLSNSTTAGLHAVMDQDNASDTVFQGALASPPARTAWGLTQVHSNAVTSGTALLIDPMQVAVVDRMQPTAYMTDSHGTNFTANLLTLLLELRMGLALFAPLGVLLATFNGTT